MEGREKLLWWAGGCWLSALAVALGAWPGAAAAAADTQPTEIIVSIVGGAGNPEFDAGFHDLAAAYQARHPAVRVILENKGNGYGAGYTTWLNTQLASGVPRPDIVSGNYVPDYAHYLNLDYYGGFPNPYTGRPMNEGLDFNFYKSMNSRGERTMLATQMVKVMWYYNADVFARLGLIPPQTWDEFIATCAKLRAAGLVPTSLRFNYRFYQWLFEIFFDQYSRPYLELIRARPGDWCFDPARDANWRYDPSDPFNDATPTVNYLRLLGAIRSQAIPYDDPAFIHTLDTLKSLAPYVPADFLVDTPTADTEAYTLFLNGVAAMHLDLSRLLVQLDDDVAGAAHFRWGTFDTPSQVNALVKAPARSVESALGEYISIIHKNQARTEQVLDFVHFWLSPAGYQVFVDGQIKAGSFRPSGPVMVRGVELPARYRNRFAAMVRKGNAETQLNSISGFLPPGSRLLHDFKQTLTELMQGKIESPEAARRIQAMMLEGVTEVAARNRLDESSLAHPERDPSS
jgi:raffinose/stachyose/melibiose transport system substrate-binding protein